MSIAISVSDSLNGCIHVVSGSHRWLLRKWGRVAAGTTTKREAAMTPTVELAQSEFFSLQPGAIPQQHRSWLWTEPLRIAVLSGAACLLHADETSHPIGFVMNRNIVSYTGEY